MVPSVAPFRGLLYSSKKVDLSEVVAPPYDVISPNHQERLYARHPYNVVRLILGKEFPHDTVKENRYTRAAQDLDRWIREGILVREPAPAYYLYEQTFTLSQSGQRRRRGFIGLRRLEEFGEKIRPHEQTMSGPKQDRLQLLQSCRTNLSPIFSLYADPSGEVRGILAPFYQSDPAIDLTDDEAVRHRLWRVTDPVVLQKLSERMSEQKLFIADGHHRYEISLRYRDLMKQHHSEANAPFDSVMMFFAEIGDPGLVILPTHRLLLEKTLDPNLVREKLNRFHLESFGTQRDFLQGLHRLGKRHGFGLGFSRPPYWVCSTTEDLETLDVLMVHEILFKKILNFTEADEKNPAKIRYLKEVSEVFKMLEEADRMAVFLNPIAPHDLIRVMEQGLILPPKTTYFYPKLLTGFVFHPLGLP